MPNVLLHDDLKAKHRRERDDWPQELSIRIHRALSWWGRAEQCTGDPDSEFIFLWIAFNAAYGRFIEDEWDDSTGGRQRYTSERQRYSDFVDMLLLADLRTQRISMLLFDEFSEATTRLIGNHFVLLDFWKSAMGTHPSTDWRKQLNTDENQASSYQKKRRPAPYLMLVLSRLQVLRNQLMHGAATWNGKINREQVQDAAAFMRHFVPLIIDIMMTDPDQEWGDVMYPVQY